MKKYLTLSDFSPGSSVSLGACQPCSGLLVCAQKCKFWLEWKHHWCLHQWPTGLTCDQLGGSPGPVTFFGFSWTGNRFLDHLGSLGTAPAWASSTWPPCVNPTIWLKLCFDNSSDRGPHNSCRLPSLSPSSKGWFWLRPNWWGVTTMK
jgi:hypothetical protein